MLHKPYWSSVVDELERISPLSLFVCINNYNDKCIPVTVQLHVPWHFTIRDSIWRFLQLQYLEVNTFAFIRHDKKWIQRTWWTTCLVTVKHRCNKSLSWYNKVLREKAVKLPRAGSVWRDKRNLLWLYYPWSFLPPLANFQHRKLHCFSHFYPLSFEGKL